MTLPLSDGQSSILVVDDEEQVRAAIARQLRLQGHTILTASTGAEALDIVRREKIAAMLLDTHLPGTSAIELVPGRCVSRSMAATFSRRTMSSASAPVLAVRME